MKNWAMYAIAVMFYITMVIALVVVYLVSSTDQARLIGMNVVSTVLMTVTLILAVFFMKNKDRQHMYEQFEEIRKKDQEEK